MRNVLIIILSCFMLQGCVGAFKVLNPFSGSGTKSADALKANPRLKRQIKNLNSEKEPKKPDHLIESERKVLYALGKKLDDVDVLADKIDTPPKSKEDIKKEIDTAKLLHDGLTTSLGMPHDKHIDKRLKRPNSLVKDLRNQVKEFRRKESKWRENQSQLHDRIKELQAMISVLQSEKQEKSFWQKLLGLGWWFIIISALVFVLVPGGPMIVSRIWSKLGEGFMAITKQGIKAGGQLSEALAKHMEKLDDEERKKLKDDLKNNMDKDVQDYWDNVKRGNHPLNEIVDNMPKGAKKRYNKKHGSNNK